MRKFHVLGLALVAVFAFFAIASTSAFAELVWLVNGTAVAETLNAETQGELNLLTLNAGGTSLNEILCEAIFDGTIGPNGKDSVTALLNTAQQLIELGVLALECKVEFDEGSFADCEAGKNALLWPENLPWSTQLELMETGTEPWLDLFGPATGGEPAYEVECKTLLGATATDLCEGHTSAQMLEVLEQWLAAGAFGAHGEFNTNSEEGKCSVSGSPSGELGLGVTWAIGVELERLETDVSEV